MPKTTIYLIRHAETIGNAEGIIQGQTMGGTLSKHGTRQAQALGRWAAAKDVSPVYSSPLSRAAATAKIAFPNATIIEKDGLMEQDAGELSGKTIEEAFRIFHKMNLSGAREPERTIDYFLLRYGHELSGESAKDVAERGMKALGEIAKVNAGKSVAVVSHGNLNKCVLCAITGYALSYENFKKMVQGNCCINTIEFGSDGPSVVAINDTRHLDSVER
jgi:probable phosphoglycerate mutase